MKQGPPTVFGWRKILSLATPLHLERIFFGRCAANTLFTQFCFDRKDRSRDNVLGDRAEFWWKEISDILLSAQPVVFCLCENSQCFY